MVNKKLSQEQIQTIIDLTRNGSSVREVAQIIDVMKGVVYHHSKKIKGNVMNPIKILSNDEELIGEFIGLFAGDGCVNVNNYRHRIFLYFNIKEKEYVDKLIENVLMKLFGKRPMSWRDENRLNLYYYSKNIHDLIKKYLTWDRNQRKTYSVRLYENEYSVGFAIGFLRGCLDSDGHISENKIEFATTSTGLADNITQFLDKFGISYKLSLYKEKRTNRHDIFHIYVHKIHHQKFRMLVKPRNLKGTNAPAGIRTQASG